MPLKTPPPSEKPSTPLDLILSKGSGDYQIAFQRQYSDLLATNEGKKKLQDMATAANGNLATFNHNLSLSNFDQTKPYVGTQGFQDAIGQWTSAGTQVAPEYAKQIQGYANSFSAQFKNYVGRDPTADEYNTFFNDIVVPAKLYGTAKVGGSAGDFHQAIQGELSTVFSRTAQDYAQQQAEADAAKPDTALDTWATAYRNSFNDVEARLQDFQSRLFEKIRPNLITSLKAQGLLDTGALNTAFAGAAENLTATSKDFMASARTQAEQDIAGQKLARASLPFAMKQQTALTSLPNLTSFGQNALSQAWQNQAQLNYANLMNQYQKDLYNMQMANSPSLLQQYGGQIIGGAAAGFAAKKWGG